MVHNDNTDTYEVRHDEPVVTVISDEDGSRVVVDISRTTYERKRVIIVRGGSGRVRRCGEGAAGPLPAAAAAGSRGSGQGLGARAREGDPVRVRLQGVRARRLPPDVRSAVVSRLQNWCWAALCIEAAIWGLMG